MSTHTLGPWTLLPGTYEDGCMRKIVAKDHTQSMYILVSGGDPIHISHNARLIAQAPNLLKELRLLVICCVCGQNQDGIAYDVQCMKCVPAKDAMRQAEGFDHAHT